MKLLVIVGVVAFTLQLVASSKSRVEVEADGSVVQGASGLKMNSTSQVGEDMFEMSGGRDKDTKIKFGFAQIVELDSEGVIIDRENHTCNFHKDTINCTTSSEVIGSLSAVDELGEPVKANYTKITKTCDLSTCNTNSSATLLVSSYIMLNKAYICQPDCETEDRFQSPVFNGTAKWEVELKNWDFCTAAECGGRNATDMKIFFSIRGSRGGKEMKPKKKDKVPFDKSKGKSADACKKKFGDDMDTTGRDDSNKPENTTNGTETVVNKRDSGPRNETDKSNGGNIKKGNRKGKGRCRNSLSSSFGDEPDDQEGFSLADDSGTEDQTVFRMYGMAVVDGTTVLADGTGFVGPIVESAEFTVGDSKQKKTREYVTIQVSKFNNKMIYDPTVDMDATGGIYGDAENAATGVTSSFAVLLISTLILLLLNNEFAGNLEY